jgi:hypothetical protein
MYLSQGWTLSHGLGAAKLINWNFNVLDDITFFATMDKRLQIYLRYDPPWCSRTVMGRARRVGTLALNPVFEVESWVA